MTAESPGEWRLASGAPAETRALGERIGAFVETGTVLLLAGELGAGKTVLAQGVGAGLDVPGVVNSPTFVLVNEYLGGRLPFAHADLYRLTSLDEIEELALDEIGAASVLLIEWPERLGPLIPAERLEIDLMPGADANARALRLRATGARAGRLLAALRAEA